MKKDVIPILIEEIEPGKDVCKASLGEQYEFRRCNKPAKYYIVVAGDKLPVCYDHAKDWFRKCISSLGYLI